MFITSCNSIIIPFLYFKVSDFFYIYVCQSITFDEFKEFCLFTYHLEDFAFSVKMINDANRPIGMGKTNLNASSYSFLIMNNLLSSVHFFTGQYNIDWVT